MSKRNAFTRPVPRLETPGALFRFARVFEEKKGDSSEAAVPLANKTAHPKSFAAKSIIIITRGDEFPAMVAGPQQPPLIMAFCSRWQSLPRQMAHSQQRTHTHTHT